MHVTLHSVVFKCTPVSVALSITFGRHTLKLPDRILVAHKDYGCLPSGHRPRYPSLQNLMSCCRWQDTLQLLFLPLMHFHLLRELLLHFSRPACRRKYSNIHSSCCSTQPVTLPLWEWTVPSPSIFPWLPIRILCTVWFLLGVNVVLHYCTWLEVHALGNHSGTAFQLPMSVHLHAWTSSKVKLSNMCHCINNHSMYNKQAYT